ncbi:MAG: transglutaminase family protein [Deltaproteobacteria bacterium]|nr:transglutaminase family protein [Deltaproteobacteria bacterium]
MTENSERWLAGSPRCDIDNPALRERAFSLIHEEDDSRERALAVFRFIRDDFPFGLGLQHDKASDVLARGKGDCCITANLQAALLKVLGVPSRMRVTIVRGEALYALIPGWMHLGMPKEVGHCWPECQLDGKWIACEALLDPPLVRGMRRVGVIGADALPTLDWDGETDLILFGDYVIEDLGPFPHIDAGMAYIEEHGLAHRMSLPSVTMERLFGWAMYDLMDIHIRHLREG